MAGISSKAAGTIQNKEKTFQGQRFDDDLGLNWVQFKWRNHDPQLGRFIEIDPLSEKYEYNSTYAFSENKVTSHVELEGLESEWAITVWQATQQYAASNGPVVGKVILVGGAVATVAAFIGGVAAVVSNEVIKTGEIAEQTSKASIESKVYSTTFLASSLVLNNYSLFSKAADANKNEKHGDGGSAKTKSEKQIEQLIEKLKGATGRLKKQIEQKIKNINKDAAQKAKGEEHSRVSKR